MDSDFDINSYIERYCNTYHCSPEAAAQEKIVQNVKEYYEQQRKEN